MRYSRRELLRSAATAASLTLACKAEQEPRGASKAVATDRAPSPAEKVARHLHSGDHVLAWLIGQLREGLSLDVLTEGTALCALTRCYNESAGPNGIVSHALLGVWPALRLSAHLPEPRRAIPVLQAAVFVANESRRSPYAPTPYELPAWPSPIANADLVQAIAAQDVDRADAALHASLNERGLEPTGLALIDAATAELGHVGHGAIMVAQMLGMIRRLDGAHPELLRAPTRYMASFSVPDDTTARAERAPEARGGFEAAAMHTFLRLDRRDPLISEAHIVTSAVSVADALTWAGAQADPKAAARASSWLDMMLEGATELGTIALRPPVVPGPPPPQTAPDDVRRALERHDPTEMASLAASLSDANLTPTIAFLVELACSHGGPTIQHSLKLLDATLAAGARAPEDQRWLAVATAMRGASSMLDFADSSYSRIVEALGVGRHPLV